MADRVDEFTAEFEAALGQHRAHTEAVPLIGQARRAADRLARILDDLDHIGIRVSLRASKLASLDHELEALRPRTDLESLVRKAQNLLQVIDDGFVDGDATRLRELLADSAAHAPVQRGGGRSGQTYLPAAVRVRCDECETVIVGRKQPGRNWNAVTKSVRDHSREVHGGYTVDLRDQLRMVLRGLRAGDTAARAGRYEFQTA